MYYARSTLPCGHAMLPTHPRKLSCEWPYGWVPPESEFLSMAKEERAIQKKWKTTTFWVVGDGEWVVWLVGPKTCLVLFATMYKLLVLYDVAELALSLSPFGSGYVCSLVHKTKSSRENMSRRVGRSEQQENKASWILFVLPHPPAANAALCSFRDVLLLLCCCCSYVYRTLCGAIAAVKCDLASSSSKGTHARCRAKRTEWTNGLGLVLGYWFYHHVPRL